MPQYTVFIEENPEDGFPPPYPHDTYEDLATAEEAVRAAELAYPNGAVWVEDEEGNVIQRQTDDYPNCEIPEAPQTQGKEDEDEEYVPHPLEVADEIRRTCPHSWHKMSDGLFHCEYDCGVRPHKPHPGEVND